MIKINKVILLAPLLVVLLLQSLSSERLVVRYSHNGDVKFLLESDAASTPFDCTNDNCCSMKESMLSESCQEHEAIYEVQTTKMLCCSELPFGGGLTTASKISPLQINLANLSYYDDKIRYSSHFKGKIFDNSISFQHGPPGFVKTTILRL